MNVYCPNSSLTCKRDSCHLHKINQEQPSKIENGKRRNGSLDPNCSDCDNSFDTIHPNSPWSCPDSISEFSELKRPRTKKNQVIGVRLTPTTLRKLIMEVDDITKLKVWDECTHLFFSCLGFDIDEQFQIGWLPQSYWVHNCDVLNDARTYMELIAKIKAAHPNLQIVYSLPAADKTFGICVTQIFKNNLLGFWHSLIKCCEGRADAVELNMELCPTLPLNFWKSYEDFKSTLPPLFIVLCNSDTYLRNLPYTVAQIADTSPDLYVCLNSFGFKNGFSSSCQDLNHALGLLWNRGFFPEDIVVGIDSCGIEERDGKMGEMFSNKEIRRLRMKDVLKPETEGYHLYVDTCKGSSVLYNSETKSVIHFDSDVVLEMKVNSVQHCQGIVCGDYFNDSQLLFKVTKLLKSE